jgi:hypothetical protein
MGGGGSGPGGIDAPAPIQLDLGSQKPESLVGIGAGIVATEIKNDPIVPKAFDAEDVRQVRARFLRFFGLGLLSTGLEQLGRRLEPGQLRSAALVGAGTIRVLGGVQGIVGGAALTGFGLGELGLGAVTANPLLAAKGAAITGVGSTFSTAGSVEFSSGALLVIEGFGGQP